MNDKIRQEAMHLHNWCEEQCDCAHCDFGRDNRTCKINGIPAQWFDDEDHSADVGNMVKTRQETVSTRRYAYGCAKRLPGRYRYALRVPRTERLRRL